MEDCLSYLLIISKVSFGPETGCREPSQLQADSHLERWVERTTSVTGVHTSRSNSGEERSLKLLFEKDVNLKLSPGKNFI